MRRLVVALALAACGGSPPHAGQPAHEIAWTQAADVLFGVELPAAGGFRVQIVDDGVLYDFGAGEPPVQSPAPATLDRTHSLPRAPGLELADLAFAADVAARKADGWAAAFAPDGWMLSKGHEIVGAATGDVMRELLDAGTLAWAPIASGVRGDIGFTVGTATYSGAEHWRSAYVTIWARQPDGTWKVRFDTGRPIPD